MATFLLLLVLHSVAVTVIVVGRALHSMLRPAPTEQAAARAGTTLLDIAAPIPLGWSVEGYAQAGLEDLQIMLVQAARRRHE